ncbi:MAG TPA: S24 family peptidase [Gemmatimonadaceae bacterium]
MTRENQISATESTGLVRLMGRLLDASGDCAAYEDGNFAAWLEREIQGRRIVPDHRESEQRDEVLAREVVRRAQARIRAVRVGESLPLRPFRLRAAPVVGNVKQVARDAAESRCAPWVESLAVAAGPGREIWDEPCEQWVELPAEARAGEYLALTVAGDSMTPCLHGGDVILVNPRKAVTRDCIVVARRADDGYENGYVVKHVTRCGKSVLELSSFNSEYAPFTIERTPGAVVGVVVARLVRGGGAS